MRILAKTVLTAATIMMASGANAQAPDAERICLAAGTPADQKIVACASVITEASHGDLAEFASVYVSRGNAYLGKKQHDLAIADFDQAIKLDPAASDAYFGRGLAFQAKAGDAAPSDGGFAERAIADYGKVVELRPKSAGAYSNRGQLYLREQKFDLAIADFTQAIQLNPGSPAFLQNRAITYKAMRKSDLAIADYRQALTLDLDAATRRRIETALNEIGPAPSGGDAKPTSGGDAKPAGGGDAKPTGAQAICLADGTAPVQKVASCTSVITGAPPGAPQTLASFHVSRGMAFVSLHVYPRALPDFDAAVQLDPSNALAFKGRGLVLVQQRQLDRAIADFDQAIKLDPRDEVSLVNRGGAYRDKGRFDRALQDYDSAIKLNSSSADAYFGRALTFQQKARYDFDAFLNEGSFEDRAIADYGKMLELRPKSAGAYSNRGDLYRRERKYDLAIADFTQAIQLNAADADFFQNRAYTYTMMRRYDLAIADYRKVLTMDVDAGRRKYIQSALSELGAAP